MTDEHIAKAVADQLYQKDVDVLRLLDVLEEGTPDPEVLEYCYQQNIALITLDEGMRGHIKRRTTQGRKHAGVFQGTHHLQGSQGIGIIVNFILFYDEGIKEQAATVEDDVYNRVIAIK